MTPYGSFTYFAFLIYPLALALVLGLTRLLGARTILLLSLCVLAFQFLNPLGDQAARIAGLRQLRFLVIYVLVSLFAILGYGFVRRRGPRQWLFYTAIAVTLLPLAAVKVFPLLAAHGWLWRFGIFAGEPTSFSGQLASPGLFDTFGFLGISYMTFRSVDAIITIHDGLAKPEAMGLLSYLLFFPTVSAGPIDRYGRFVGELERLPLSRREHLLNVEDGIQRIAQGFLYKFVIAYLVSRYLLQPAAAESGWTGQVRYMYAYSFYLFFDFAGYSAFAIGVGRMLGITVPENFKAPFLSRTFQEMWNRWHISLSFWLRDHVYMRFLRLTMRRKWFAGSRQLANYAALTLTFLLMGCWHGLAPHYIVYGLYQAVMMVVYDLVGRWNQGRQLLPLGWRTDAVGWLLTFNLFCFGLLIFSGHLFQ